MSKELMIERIEKAQKEIEASRENFVRTIILWQKPDGSMTQMG